MNHDTIPFRDSAANTTMEAASSSSSDDDDSSQDSSSSSVRSSSSKEHVKIIGERKAASQRRQQQDSSSSDSESDSENSESSDNSDDDSESDNDDDEKDEGNENKVASMDMPLGEIIRQQQQEREQRGLDMTEKRARQEQARKIASERVGRRTKKHAAASDQDDANDDDDDEKATKKLSKFKKETKESTAATLSRKGKSKHAPTEVSSKRRDFYERKLRGMEQPVGAGTGVDLGAHTYKPRDPRISSLSGHLDEEHFERNYAFLNDMRNAEIELLKKRIAAHKATGKKGQRLRQRLFSKSDHHQQGGIGRHFAGTTLDENVQELKRLQQEKAALERNQVDRNAKRAVKQHVKETSGGGTYYLKRHEKKRLHVEAKYEEIRKRGGDAAVDKVLAKRRKKNKSKDAGLLGGGKLAAAGGSDNDAKRFRY